MYIDTHSHLFVEEFDEDRNEVIERALRNGVERILLPNIDLSSIDRLRNMTEQYSGICYGMMGLHPGSVGADWEKQLQAVKEALDQDEYVAIGEIGMDLYWDKTFVEEQRIVFTEQVRWAKEKKLPIAIHAREAFEEIFQILDNENSPELRGVFHCFTGNLDQANKIIEYGGFKMGVGGVLTYKKSGLDEVLKSVSPVHLILETDSPYLTPVPYRGKRNESSYLVYIAEKLADVYGLPLKEIEKITTESAEELFRIPV